MIKFGPSGNSASFFDEGFKTGLESAEWTKKRGLDCFEYSFGRGVNISKETAIKLGESFKKADVELSVHAPYFINFANPDDEMAAKSYGYVLSSAAAAVYMQADRIVFHPAAQGKMQRDEAVSLTEKRLEILRDKIYENGFENIKFCPETMGKLAQIGTVEEITKFCKLDKIFYPCVDFGHVNAREQGSLRTEDDFAEILDYMIKNLGYEKVNDMHVHFSKIEYGKKGEIRHLTFEDNIYGPEFEPLAKALIKFDLHPYIVCESAGTQAEDALYMKRSYENLLKTVKLSAKLIKNN